MMTPLGRGIKTLTQAGTIFGIGARAASGTKGAEMSERASRLVNGLDKVSTAGNLSAVGLSRNTATGFMYSYGEGLTLSQSIVGGIAGGTLPAVVSGGAKASGHVYDYIHSLASTHIGKVDATVIKKAEKYAGLGEKDGITREQLDAVYYGYAKTINVDVNDLTPADKLAALKQHYSSIKDITKASAASTPVAQATADAKAKEQVNSLLREVFSDVEHLESTKPIDIKDSIAGQVRRLQTTIQNSIEEIDSKLNEFNYQFNIAMSHKQLDVPEPTNNYIEALYEVNDIPKKLLDDVESFAIDTPVIKTAGDAKALREILGAHGNNIDLDNVPINDRLDNLVLEIADETQAGAFMTHQDNLYMREYLDRLQTTSRLFKNNATPTEKANAVRKFLSTDSYAPLTKVVDQEALVQLENLALSSLFLKDNILTNEGRINFWRLYQDASAIITTTPEMSAVKQLMKAYSEAIGNSKTKPVSKVTYETGGSARPSVKSEILSRSLGNFIANVLQHTSSDVGRSTYLVNHAYKLINGERVLRSKDLNTAVLAKNISTTLDDVNQALTRAGYSAAFIANNVSEGNGGRSTQTQFTFFTKPGAVKDGRFVYDGETYDIVKSDLKFNKYGNTIGESFHATRLTDHPYWPKIADMPVEWVDGDVGKNVGTHVELPKNSSSNTPAHEIEHVIQDIEERVGYGSSPIREVSAIKQVLPEFDDDLLSDPDMARLVYGAYLQKTNVQALTSDIVNDLLNRSPWLRYRKNIGERMANATSIVKATGAEYPKAIDDQIKQLVATEEQHIRDAYEQLIDGKDFLSRLKPAFDELKSTRAARNY
jgi:hypothetical protein